MSSTILTATYRVVTPMFLGGADPLREAELRVPSFKGALRFWWRAIMWSEVLDLVRLRQCEAALFGSSEAGQSKVLIHSPATLASTQKVSGIGRQRPGSATPAMGCAIKVNVVSFPLAKNG